MNRLVAVGLLIVLGPGCARPQGPAAITLSRETTYLVAPLKADGTPDYYAALDARYGKGVTPENNAAVPLVQAFGPQWLPAAVLERLGLRDLPASGEYFAGVRDGAFADRLVQAGEATDREAAKRALLAAIERPWWSAGEDRLLTRWLEANQKPLALIVEGVKRPRFWIPFPEGTEVTTPIPSLLYYREAADALVSRAMLRLRSGDMPGAAADVLTALRLADRVAQGPSLVDALVGIALRGVGSGALPRVAAHPRLPAEDLTSLLVELRALRDFPSLAERVDQSERFMTLGTVLLLHREGMSRGPLAWKELLEAKGLRTADVPPGLYQVPATAIDWNEVLRIVNRWYDACSKALGAPTVGEEHAALAELQRAFAWTQDARKALEPSVVEALVRSAPQDPASRSRLTRAFAAVMLPESLLLARVSRREAAAQFALAETTTALLAHRRQKGSLPKDLAAAKLPEGVRPERHRDGYEFRYYTWPEVGENAATPIMFAYVAVPERPGVTGIRSFCVDARGISVVTGDGVEPRVLDAQCKEPKPRP